MLTWCLNDTLIISLFYFLRNLSMCEILKVLSVAFLFDLDFICFPCQICKNSSILSLIDACLKKLRLSVMLKICLFFAIFEAVDAL